MGPPSYTRSVVDFVLRISVYVLHQKMISLQYLVIYHQRNSTYMTIIRETYKSAYIPEDGMQINKTRIINKACISTVKPTRCTIFFNFILFCSNTLHVSDGLFVHHRECKTVHTASGICQTGSADSLLAGKR
jgi:hypothetical protein